MNIESDNILHDEFQGISDKYFNKNINILNSTNMNSTKYRHRIKIKFSSYNICFFVVMILCFVNIAVLLENILKGALN